MPSSCLHDRTGEGGSWQHGGRNWSGYYICIKLSSNVLKELHSHRKRGEVLIFNQNLLNGNIQLVFFKVKYDWSKLKHQDKIRFVWHPLFLHIAEYLLQTRVDWNVRCPNNWMKKLKVGHIRNTCLLSQPKRTSTRVGSDKVIGWTTTHHPTYWNF